MAQDNRTIMNEAEFDQLLLSELRLVCIAVDKDTVVDDERLLKAMTVNEQLLAVGYTLSTEQLFTLARSEDLDGFMDRIGALIGDVKAKPMYPDFPSQVMEMDEAELRLHQIIHYFTTYGIEELTGLSVSKGWLPEVEDTEKTEAPDALLCSQVIELIDSSERYSAPYGRILSKTERLNDKERMIVRFCAEKMTAEELCSVSIRFKENMKYSFHAVFMSEALSQEDKLICLNRLCQHSGDVLKSMDYSLTRCGYHFRTSQKKLLVKLLESYSAADLSNNLILSGRRSQRCLLMLRYIDYNEYSRSAEHARIVKELRDGELRSWESAAKKALASDPAKGAEFYAQRPGMMLRSLTLLYRSGCSEEMILNSLRPKAGELSVQTLMNLMNHFSRPEEYWEEGRYAEAQVIRNILSEVLYERLASAETPLRGKRVYLHMEEYALEHSYVLPNSSSSEGGYVRSGIAYRIPENVSRLRFFVYWNDEKRVDVDLHAAIHFSDGTTEGVGWCSSLKTEAVVFSGDITHSDAAEFIDIDLDRIEDSVTAVSANIDLYAGRPTFGEIGECFVGMMAVDRIGKKLKLYSPANCFFSHNLTGSYTRLYYGVIDPRDRVLRFIGKPDSSTDYYSHYEKEDWFHLSDFLDILFRAQGAAAADSPEDADLTLVMGKPLDEKQVSLIDNNFFMERDNK